MKNLVEGLKDLVYSYIDLEDPEELINACTEVLGGVKNDIVMAMEVLPDNVAFGIYSHVHLTDRGQMFLNQCDVLTEELPSWQEIQKQKFFEISGEGEFIRSLPEIDERQAVTILFAVATVKAKIGEKI